MGHPYFELPTPIVIGHRGAAGEAPENTLASFERGLADGAAILESDVHLTRDGVVVMLHDEHVDRTTDGTGDVRELRLEEVAQLDAGHWFSTDEGRTFPFRGRGVRIPTFEEALTRFPGARFNLELKDDDPDLVERALELVARTGRAELTLLTAATDALMERLRARAAALGVPVAIGAAAGDVLRFVRSGLDASAPPSGPMALQVPAEFAGRPLVTPELVRHAHAHGVQVHVWTINEETEMSRLLDLGVDGLVTDHPARMRALVARRSAATRD